MSTLKDHKRNSTIDVVNRSYDPFLNENPRKKTTRRQRLRLDGNDNNHSGLANHSNSNANIYYPGEQKLEDQSERDYFTDTRQIMHNRGFNKSQNMSYYSQNINDSPKQAGLRIKEAQEDHYRDGVEPNRYFSRLDQSNRKQRKIFDKHYLKYIMPTVNLVNAKRENEQVRYREAKNRMDQLEIEHYNKSNQLKSQYKEYLMNQMAEKQRLRQTEMDQKKVAYDHIEYKRKMYEDEMLNNYIDK